MRNLTPCVLFFALCLGGCKSARVHTAASAMAPCNVADFDCGVYSSLAEAHAFEGSTSMHAATLTLPQHEALDAFSEALKDADRLYVAYHAGQVKQPILAAALNKVAMTEGAFVVSVR